MLLNVRMAPKSFLWECWFLLLSSEFIVQKTFDLLVVTLFKLIFNEFEQEMTNVTLYKTGAHWYFLLSNGVTECPVVLSVNYN